MNKENVNTCSFICEIIWTYAKAMMSHDEFDCQDVPV